MYDSAEPAVGVLEYTEQSTSRYSSVGRYMYMHTFGARRPLTNQTERLVVGAARAARSECSTFCCS